ncbi:hypothetical protein ALC57_00407, partial [Trachymyrmex cornetzi]
EKRYISQHRGVEKKCPTCGGLSCRPTAEGVDECETVVEATELCFKLFHAYHSDYPPESRHVWQLIQQGFYNVFIKNHDLSRRTISKSLADIGIELDEEKIKSSKSKKIKKV